METFIAIIIERAKLLGVYLLLVKKTTNIIIQ